MGQKELENRWDQGTSELLGYDRERKERQKREGTKGERERDSLKEILHQK